MINRETVRSVLRDGDTDRKTTVYGWVRTSRQGKNIAFAAINDGSCQDNLQVVFDRKLFDNESLACLATGACIKVKGLVAGSPGGEQSRELHAESLTLIGKADENYPLQKKRHSLEFLRTIPHLRTRSNTFTAVFRTRHHLSMAIHRFFDEKGFYYVHPPLITSSDCEGAGQTFQVTKLDLKNIKEKEDKIDYSNDFFKRKAYLTVSAQLEAEPLALAMGGVYTFGPTFRADPSDTRIHSAEFWMIEPEMAFYDLDDDIVLIQEFLKYITTYVRDNCQDELAFFTKFIEPDLESRYDQILNRDFERVTYTEALTILENNRNRFEIRPEWGKDFVMEHERFLAKDEFNGPVFITNYPASFKPFYMRLNDDGKTVACTDLLVPDVGEILTGSQREERLDILTDRAKKQGIDLENYKWYFETRLWGSAPHSGFGLGLERILMYLTGMQNIRDVLPFPRTAGNMT